MMLNKFNYKTLFMLTKIICICLLSLSCTVSQPEYLGEKPYDLTAPDFSTNAEQFYSKTSSPYIRIEAEYLSEDENNRRGILYSQRGSLTTTAVFGSLSFKKMSMVTDLDDHLSAISASEPQVIEGNPEEKSKQLKAEITETINQCNKQYGKPQMNERKFFNVPNSIYTWDAGDQLVKIVFPSGILGENPVDHIQIRSLEYEPGRFYETFEPFVSLFIIKKEFADSIVGRVNSGEYLYCKP
jgi:hypothetical protein